METNSADTNVKIQKSVNACLLYHVGLFEFGLK